MWRLLRTIAGRRPGSEEPPAAPDQQEPRRVAARHRLRVSFSLTVLDPKSSPGVEPQTLMLEGHTQDVSASGMALIVPSLSLKGRDLSKPGQAFLLEIELPSGRLRFQAAVARHERLDVDGEERYLLGVRITDITDANRAQLKGFLREARREHR